MLVSFQQKSKSDAAKLGDAVSAVSAMTTAIKPKLAKLFTVSSILVVFLVAKHFLALLHWLPKAADCPAFLDSSSGEAKEAVYKAHFSRHAEFEHEAMTLADHPHDFEALDRRGSCRQRLEPASRIDHALQSAVIGF